MAGSTPFYGLAIFDFGDRLDAPLNVQKEIDRFVMIDKQLYGLYNVFGNGVLSGWEVEDNGFTSQRGISARISPGSGIINYIAAETTFPEYINGLPPFRTFYIYAVLTGSSVRDRRVQFTISFSELGDNAVRLAEVETGQQSIISVNNNLRQLIGFRQIIQDEINSHRHRGTPSKIDLRDEVKNQLPGARLDDFDASKIVSGRFSAERMPILNHEDLENDGLLTHPQLDSFVKTLSENNRELLGEIASVNLLKHVLFLKYKYADVDEHFVNELAFVPGISPNELIDLDATTAYVNFDTHCISGRPVSTGKFVSVVYDDDDAFQNAYRLTNVSVANDSVTLLRDTDAQQIIENFENLRASGETVAAFTKLATVVVDNFTVVAETADSLRTGGFYSGRFTSNRQYRASFIKTFDTAQNWTSYDELVVNIKTVTSSHGAIYGYYVRTNDDNEEVNSDIFLLAAENELTSNPDPTKNNFAEKVFNIASFARTNVKRFVIFTDDTDPNFEFYIDDLYVRNRSLFEQQGTIKLRYSTGAAVTFHSVIYDATAPEGTDIAVRVKVASSSSLLSRAGFTLPLNSGDVFALRGTDIEIDVTLVSEDRTATPSLNRLELRILTPADFNGFEIDTQADWSLGDLSNITIETDEAGDTSSLVLSEPVNVGGLSFSYLGAVREIDDEDAAVAAVSGLKTPISPNQANNWANEPLRRFNSAVSARRQIDHSFLICDRDNDRVFLMDSSGDVIKGLGSVHAQSEDFFAMTSCYNPNTGRLTVVLSKTVDRDSINLANWSLYIGSSELPLNANDSIVDSTKNEQIVEVNLSVDKQSQLANLGSSQLFLSFAAGSFAEEFAANENASALTSARGIEVYYGDFTYIDNVSHPVDAIVLENGNWAIANAGVIAEPSEAEPSDSEASDTRGNVPSIVELDPNSPDEVVFSYNDITFSDFSLGGLYEYSSTRLAAAGVLESDESITAPSSGDSTAVFVLVEYDHKINGEAANAASVMLSSQTTDPSFGIKEADSSTVVVSDNTAVSNPSTGRYTYRFLAEVGKSYTVSWEVVSVAGDEPTYVIQTVEAEADPTDFSHQGANALAGYRGVVIVIDRDTSQIMFRYMSPDGLFPSDVDVDEEGQLLVAETEFVGTGGRVIKLDEFGNVIFEYARGNLGVIRDARDSGDNNIILSL